MIQTEAIEALVRRGRFGRNELNKLVRSHGIEAVFTLGYACAIESFKNESDLQGPVLLDRRTLETWANFARSIFR